MSKGLVRSTRGSVKCEKKLHDIEGSHATSMGFNSACTGSVRSPRRWVKCVLVAYKGYAPGWRLGTASKGLDAVLKESVKLVARGLKGVSVMSSEGSLGIALKVSTRLVGETVRCMLDTS